MKWLKTSYQSQTFKVFVHAVENGFITLQHDTTTPSVNLQCWPPRAVLTASGQRTVGNALKDAINLKSLCTGQKFWFKYQRHLRVKIWLLQCWMCAISWMHTANWHSPTTLTEVFPCFFLSCKANVRVYHAKNGARSALFQISELCCSMYCLFRFCVLFVCKCVLYHCHRVLTQLQVNISYHHIVSCIISHQRRTQTWKHMLYSRFASLTLTMCKAGNIFAKYETQFGASFSSQSWAKAHHANSCV
jgi:hypothetical protein